MIFERNDVDELTPIFVENLPCIKKPVFMRFLDNELDRAERYGSYVALLIFKLNAGSSGNGAEGHFQAYAQFLKSKLRRTDYLALWEDQTLAVLLLHSKPQNTESVRDRLRSDSHLYLRARQAPCDVEVSSSVFPTEARSLDGLCETAMDRLKRAAC